MLKRALLLTTNRTIKNCFSQKQKKIVDKFKKYVYLPSILEIKLWEKVSM